MDISRKLFLALVLFFPPLSFAAEPVDINTADMQTLMSVKGIGEKRAAAIIAYREQHGRFTTVDELGDVRGISDSLLEKNREMLTVKSGKK